MKRSEAARYARWSATVAILLAAATGVFYIQRVWTAHRERAKAPAPLPKEEEKRFTTLSFKKVEANHTIFSVEASRSTDLKGQDISLLEDVKITVFGKLGERHDVIHTQSCRYSKADGGFQCEGDVQMDLQTAADASRIAAQPTGTPDIVHVDTSGVTFERSTGLAQTAQPVTFVFPSGKGEGKGAVYDSNEGILRLIRDVRIDLKPKPADPAAKANSPSVPVTILGSGLEFGKASHLLQISGPASAVTPTQRLTAGEFALQLDAENRAQTFVATPGSLNQLPALVDRDPKGEMALQAQKLTAKLSPQGWVTTILADGDVRGSSPSGNLRAAQAEMEMWPGLNQAKELTLHGDVRIDARDPKTSLARNIVSNALRLEFRGGKAGEPNRVRQAETLERGSIEWLDAPSTRSKVSGDKLAVYFGAQGKAQVVNASGNVQSERQAPGHALQTASSANGVVQLSPAGDWSQITLRDAVRLQEADRSAEAEQAVFNRAAQTSILTGRAVVRDATSETHAPKITFLQATDEVEAEGPVRSTDFSSKNSAIQLSPAPANISASHMRANTKSGRALYTGQARLWQGQSVLEADSIELLRSTRVLNASGSVRGVFPQTPRRGESPDKTPVWHVASATLTYWDVENRAHLEKDVVVQSADQRMRCPLLDLYFTRTNESPSGMGGASQISRAVGTGGVVVEQGDRRGTAERGLYTAEDEKFVLTGGTPTLFDPVEGTTTGRELTFYNADDTVVVDSGAGLRTLTRHRVQR